MKREAPPTHDVMEDLVRRATRGEELAFARLATEVRPRMYRWALIQLVDADAAEDVTQRALLRMQRGLAAFRGDAAFGTWIYTIVRSAAADWRRSERRRDAMHAKQNAQDASTEMPASPEANGLVEIVRKHMRDLPGRQREVFDLVDLQGHSPQEAAAMLSLHPATARVHLMRARRAIRARLIEKHATLVEDRL